MLTDDVGLFAGSLRPGDVLLFDKGLRASSIIAFTDLRPVSHVAIVIEGGAHATVVDATLPSVDHGRAVAVERTPLRAMFDLSHTDARGRVAAVRSITARRSVRGEATGTTDAIAARAVAWCDQRANYAWRDLGSLAPYAFVRSSDTPNSSAFVPVLRSLVQLVRRGLGVIDLREGPAVTCSELAYRCLLEAVDDGSLAPEITAPLVKDGRLHTDWPAMSEAGTRDDAGMAGMAAELQALSDDVAMHMHPERMDAVESAAPASTHDAMRGTSRAMVDHEQSDGSFRPGDIVAWASSVVESVRRPPPLELADGVTPGDLFDTRSLITVAELHLEPD